MKGTAKTIAILILSGISIFFTIVYLKTYVLSEAEITPPAGVQTVLSDTAKTDESKPIAEPQDLQTEVPVSIYRSVLPRAAVDADGGFINNVGGYSNESLVGSYYVDGYYYAILESNSDNCDLYCKVKNIAVARFDSACCLREAVTFSAETSESFLCSSLNDNGIIISTKSTNRVTVYSITFDMKVSKMCLPITAQSAISYYTSSGTVIAFVGSNAINVYCLSDDLSPIHTLSFSSNGFSKAEALYRNGNFVLFANSQTSACAYIFSFEGLSNSVNLPYIQDIVPTAEGYLIATESNGNIELHRYTYELKKIDSKKLCVGTNAAICFTGNGYFLMVYGADMQTASYFLCKHFDVISINKSDYDGIEQVCELFYSDGGVYACAKGRTSASVFRYDTNSHFADKKISLPEAQYINMYAGAQGDYVLLYDTSNSIKEHAAGWGEKDVWIRKNVG